MIEINRKYQGANTDNSKNAGASPAGDITTDDANVHPLMRNNFTVMIIAGVLIVLGFVLMAGSSSGADQYNPDIFSDRRIVVGPMLSFVGFVLMAIAIILKPKNTRK